MNRRPTILCPYTRTPLCAVCRDASGVCCHVEGSRVRLRRDVERYPSFVAPAGAVGTVTFVDDGHAGGLFEVTLDEPLAGAEEWDNAVQWIVEDDDVAGDLEAVR